MVQPASTRLLTESKRGVAGGVAGLDSAGDVVDALGVKVKGSGTVTAAAITDATTVGRNVLKAADATAARGFINLGNVDNTADVNKPISTAAQAALDAKSDKGHTHAAIDIGGALALSNLPAGSVFRIIHGTNANMVRGSARTDIFCDWQGSVAPANAIAGVDNWINTTP